MKGDDATTQPGGSGREHAAWVPEGAEESTDPVAFVIVLWLEPNGPAEEPEWRWRVRDVRSGVEARFRRVADVLEYVAARSGVSGPA